MRADYFGKTWEGNETNKLLKHTTELKKIVPEYLHIFVDCMDSLNDVKKACFGFTLDQNYKEKKEELEDLWNILHENFGVTIPNKCHVIFSHVPEFIKRQKKPLGEFSEQVVESAHQKLDQIWQWYIVKDLEKELHGTNFLKCVNQFNSFNI